MGANICYFLLLPVEKCIHNPSCFCCFRAVPEFSILTVFPYCIDIPKWAHSFIALLLFIFVLCGVCKDNFCRGFLAFWLWGWLTVPYSSHKSFVFWDFHGSRRGQENHHRVSDGDGGRFIVFVPCMV